MKGELWDIKSYEGSFKFGKLTNMMHSIVDKEQAPNMIIRLNHDLKIDSVIHSLLSRLNSSEKSKAYIKKMKRKKKPFIQS